MWNLLPLRFVILVISTPFRLLAERDKGRTKAIEPAYEAPELPGRLAGMWLGEPASVIDATTRHLKEDETLVGR